MIAGVQHAVLDPMDDRTRAQEEQRFEEGVCDQVEGCCDIAANPEGGDHEAKLRDGGIGQDAFDIILRHSNRGGKNRGE